ncbi:hypothetical protein SRHO_G00084320 [Serrasalmus rhombeus]
MSLKCPPDITELMLGVKVKKVQSHARKEKSYDLLKASKRVKEGELIYSLLLVHDLHYIHIYLHMCCIEGPISYISLVFYYFVRSVPITSVVVYGPKTVKVHFMTISNLSPSLRILTGIFFTMPLNKYG